MIAQTIDYVTLRHDPSDSAGFDDGQGADSLFAQLSDRFRDDRVRRNCLDSAALVPKNGCDGHRRFLSDSPFVALIVPLHAVKGKPCPKGIPDPIRLQARAIR
jgi:hypothetical protein